MKALHVDTNIWMTLGPVRVLNATVDIQDCGNILPFADSPVFFADTVVLRRCSREFVYYWLNTRTFPTVKTIYLDSEPCDPSLFDRFPDTVISLSPRVEEFKERWAFTKTHVDVCLDIPGTDAERLRCHIVST